MDIGRGIEGQPAVDVAIVSWNTSNLLARCVQSLEALPEASDLRLIVVDNGSIDDSADRIAQDHPMVLLVSNAENVGFAQAHNQAFQLGLSPFHLLLNSDTEVEPGTIAYCQQYLADHPEVGVVGCRLANPDGTTQNSVFRYPSLRGVLSTSFWLAQAFPGNSMLNHDRYGLDEFTEPTDVEVVMGSFIMVRRSDIEGDLLDEGFFMYAEEADLCARLQQRGLRVRFLPSVAVTHVKGGSSKTAQQRAWSDEARKRSVLRFLRKWHGPGTAYLANVIMLVGMLPRCLGWFVVDLFDRIRGRSGGRLLKARSVAFHLHAVARPSIMDHRFHGPPPPQSSQPGRAVRHRHYPTQLR